MRLTASDVVLVTGGASGLGAATVASVVAAGARAVVLDLPAAGEQVEQAERVRFVGGDVRDEADVGRAVEVASELGTLRAAVNCAGVATPGRVVGQARRAAARRTSAG